MYHFLLLPVEAHDEILAGFSLILELAGYEPELHDLAAPVVLDRARKAEILVADEGTICLAAGVGTDEHDFMGFGASQQRIRHLERSLDQPELRIWVV